MSNLPRVATYDSSDDEDDDWLLSPICPFDITYDPNATGHQPPLPTTPTDARTLVFHMHDDFA